MNGGVEGVFAGLFVSCLFLSIVVVYYVSTVCLFCRFLLFCTGGLCMFIVIPFVMG